MLEGLAAWVLNTYVGEYVENLNTHQLSIALLQGAVELDNLPLKKDALKSLGLPLEVKSGFIGKITLQIPLSRLHSEPWVISMERLYLVAGPLKDTQYDEAKEKAAEAARKAKLLEALEAKYQVQQQDKAETSSWFSYGTSVLTNILENLQLKIRDVHFRYEDDLLNPACPFALGVVIKELSAQSTDGAWVPKFVSRANCEQMHKLIDLKNFAIYFDTNTTLVGELKKSDMQDSLQREMYVSSITGQFKEHEYILSPVTSTAKMKRFTTELPLRSQTVPRNTIDLTTEKMAFNLSEDQYRNLALMLKEFDRFERKKKFRKFRPSSPVKENPASWWKFAISIHLTKIQERNKRLTKNYLIRRVQDVVKYTKTYAAELQKQSVDAAAKKHKVGLEEEYSFEELKILREVVYKKITKEGNIIKSPSPEPVAVKSPTSPEDKGVLQRWFPGWGGWYGSQPADTARTSDDTVGEPPPAKMSKSDETVGGPLEPKISKSELEQELTEVIEEVTRDAEEDKSTLKKDAVFAKLNFTLDSGSFKLLGVKTEQQTGDRVPYSILELECTGISMLFESRPRTSGMKFGISVGGLLLLDKLTEDTIFPCLVGSQNKERFSSLRQSGTPGYQKACRITTLPEDSTDNTLFELMYEKNPSGCTANRKFSMKTMPLDIVYNRAAFSKVKEIFSTKTLYASKKAELNIAASARRQYELLKRQTKQELKHTLDSLLEGSEGPQVKKWWVQLDISAPQIVIPESFQDPDTSMVMVDLGHLNFNNISTDKTPDSQTNTEDDFHTPMSTPPSEAMDEDTGEQTMNITDLSQLDLSESQFYDKLYDRYSLDLTDLQVVVGKMKDNWRHIHHRGSTKLHLIDKFSITLQLERRLIYTADPQWPNITVSGTLPQLTVHVNEHKVQTINNCLQTISKRSPTTQYPTSSPVSLSLAESSGGMEELREATLADIEEEGHAGEERMLQEVIEDSQLLLMQFSINQLSLEIHSRERAVAELQVSGVRTNLTKRPYDTAVTLTVHSLLVVDALQTYGPDFELLVASHRNITIDSTSGSLLDSGPTSPQAMSPGNVPGSPIEQLPTPTVTGSLQSVQDAVSRAFQALVSKGVGSPLSSPREDKGRDNVVSPTLDNEALILVELEMISSKSPSNTNNEGPMTIASFQFNNLDIIANQETVVEILSFLKQVSPKSVKQPLPSMSEKRDLSKSTADLFAFPSEEKESKAKFEVTADFNRLSLMFMRLDDVLGVKTARKVSTATMSCARVQASIDSELTMNGSLGGFHVFDISPDVQRHQRVFSVGQDVPHTNVPRHVYSPRDMYKTAQESVLLDELDSDTKAFGFSLSKPLKNNDDQYDWSYLTEAQTDKNCVKVSLKVASLMYTHSPRLLFEMSQCLTEFKEYTLTVANSLKKAASEVAKGMVVKRSDMGFNSMYGSSSSLDTFTGSKQKINQLGRAESEYFEGVCTADQEEPIKSKIVLDASLETPVIVIPKSATSSDVFVAHLGQISVTNKKGQVQVDDDDSISEDNKLDRVFMEMRNMNLYSVNLDKDTNPNISAIPSDGSLFNDVYIEQKGTPIIYNTTVQVTVDHIAPDVGVINPDNTQNIDFSVHREMNDSLQEIQPKLDFNATIKTPVQLVLSKNVYEQILQTVDNISYVPEVPPSDKSTVTDEDQEEAESTNKSSFYSAFKGDKSSHKFSSASFGASQKTAVFLTKQVKFEVPLFSVELRGDFGEGEQGLVDLKLHKFFLDYTKDNPVTTSVQLSLKSLVMDDLLEPPESKHRQIMVSKAPRPQDQDQSQMKPHLFLSQSCPDNAIVAPVPMMPPSLPNSFHNDLSDTKLSPVQITSDIGFLPIYSKGKTPVPRSKSSEYPCAPPPTPRTTRSRHNNQDEDNLVHISLLLVDKNSPEYVEKYNEKTVKKHLILACSVCQSAHNTGFKYRMLFCWCKLGPNKHGLVTYIQTKRFIDVDFNCLDTKINLQTWVILLDFLGLGAKVHDMETMQDPTAKPVQPQTSMTDEYVQQVVNSEMTLKVENLTIILNKQDYELAHASVSKLSSRISMRDGNLDAKGQLGKMLLVDTSPHGSLYREKFLTVGEHAMEFDFFKYGIPDPWLKRDYDMKLKMTMASVRYTHTNRFHAELLGFIQHFLQLQEVLGRMRASSAGKNINEAAFHMARILLDIEAGSPIILIPHSSRTADVLVADLGTLCVKNCFKLDGDAGTFTEVTRNKAETKSQSSENEFKKTNLSRTSSQASQKSDTASRSSSQSHVGVIQSRTTSQSTDTYVQSSSLPHPLTQSIFDELQPPRANVDLMTESIYGSLDHDIRNKLSCDQANSESVADIYDPTDMHGPPACLEGSSVDPSSPRSPRQNLLLDTSFDKNTPRLLHPPASPVLFRSQSSSSETVFKEGRNVFANNKEPESDTASMDTNQHKCLLDILEVKLSDMDLFSAERVEKKNYKRNNLREDLEFPSCVIQRRGGKLLKEKCMLNLNIERNLEGDISHLVPDWCVKGALSSVHCCLDIDQYKLIRGLLEHNLGEKFEIWKFKKELMTHMVDPNIQTVLCGDVYRVISMSVELTNVTLELLASHDQGPLSPQVSIAKLDFIRSRLSYDSYSDQSKETDLVSHEILASDTRFRDMAVNMRPSVFERILEPSSNASPHSLQLELHFRATQDGTRFMIILNNMKLMCSFDWLIRVNEFIMTKAENPFLTDMDGQQDEDTVNVVESEVSSPHSGTRTASPLSTSGGIITKRGPQVDQNDVPFELKLNVTETQFVVVENLASLDTNAVILKCTAVLSFRPKAQDKLLACTLQSLEVFSCSLQAEEDTAMSIVDPMTISIELNANPLPELKKDQSAGLVEAKEVEQRELLLEVGFSTMNVRLSYLDLRMFLAIMNSLPKQALQARQLKSSTRIVDVPYSESQLSQLEELGFSTIDCETALEMTTGDTDAAAVWLTENAKVITPKKDDLKITKVELKANGVFVCLIDDCQDADVPLVELGFSGVNFNLRLDPSIEGKATFQIAADYYNRALSGWETLIEQWRCHTDWKHYNDGKEKKFAIQITAQDVLNVNMTQTLIDLYNSTKVKWTEDYYKEQEDSPQKEGVPTSAVRRRQMFTPYKIRNQTGSPLWFLTVTMSPSSVGSDSFHGQKLDDAYIQATEWKMVPPNEEFSFAFFRREKIRHKKSHYLRVNQLVVKIDGWQRLSPVSVDKVGIYFRDTLPDITKHSIIKVNEGQPARVVFDVSQQGSALKVITLRSALIVSNQLDGPIELRMENPIIPGRYEYMSVQTDQQKPIPMTFVNSKLWVKPSDWPVGFCRQPVEWQHVRRAGEISNNVRACEMSGMPGSYRYCVTIRRELFPPEHVKRNLHPLPGHTLLVIPTVTMVNLLPIEMNYYFKGTEIAGTVKAGQEAQLHAADLDSSLELGIHLENFPKCRELHIPAGTENYKVKLRLYDNKERLLELNVRILARYGAALRLSISAPHWLVNKSGLPLVFRQDDCSHESAGQFEEHELARSVTPLLFSFTEKELPYLCMMRLGKSVHGRSGLPQWCNSFSLDSGTGVRQLHVAPSEGNRPDWNTIRVSSCLDPDQDLCSVSLGPDCLQRLSADNKDVASKVYNIGIDVMQGKGQFRNTNIVTFAPRYEIDNQSGHKLAISQRHFTSKEAIRNPDGHLTAMSKCKLPFHWPRQDLDQLLCVKLLDVAECNWSGGFRIDRISSFHVNMRDDRRNSQLLKVDILLQGPTYHIIFTDSQEVPPPFVIDNHSEVPILYFQTKTQEERLRTTIKPHTSLSYAWDEPTLDPYMTLSVANGTTSTYNLNILGEAEQLTYQNFIYISATSTFSRPGVPYSQLQTKELVLDCQHENHVVFKKKETGKRSQLWRMTPGGMLEHEGQAPPMDPRKQSSSGSRHRLVLDIADIALQPGKPIPLALKKADERRVVKQTWKFKDGMLCSSSGNFCVQALNGIEGYQDGAIAMLGPGPTDPSDTNSIPLHMLTSSEKLHPGSGCLTVRVQMDGPVRVLQIADIQHRRVVKISNPDMEDWEIYEESLNQKRNEKRRIPATKNMDLSLNLKGGLGISLVNRIPEEILYISLKNITVSYLTSKRAITMEMSVANIQADNQLFGTQRPIMLYVTPTTRRDVPDNTPALHIAAHKVPNANWNAEIFKHLMISMKKLTVQLEEKLLWKLVQFRGYSQSDPSIQKLKDNSSDLQKTLAAATSVKSKRYYFGQLKINSSLITLSMITTSQLSPELRQLKKTMSIPLIRFEDAKVSLAPFSRQHLFDTSTFLIEEITTHYKEELMGQAAKILGSVDFLGNPLGLFNDVTEGVKGLIEEGNVGGLVKNVAHGVSNSTAKVVGSLSDGIGKVHLDAKHNTKREQIRSTSHDSGGQFVSGMKGLGHGMLGGFKSVLKPFEGARKGGAEGFVVGLYEGVTGMVTKPVVGILDFASGTANAIRDTSRRSSHMQPGRVREPRCCHGPGGLLPVYSEKQAEAQSILYMLNDQRYEEEFLIALETVRSHSSDSIYALITSIQVYFLHSLEPHRDSVILNVMHKHLALCKSIENVGRHYVEITKKDDSASTSRSSELKKPQIRCDKRTTAQKVAQQILYAKNLFDEQKQMLHALPNEEDEF